MQSKFSVFTSRTTSTVTSDMEGSKGNSVGDEDASTYFRSGKTKGALHYYNYTHAGTEVACEHETVSPKCSSGVIEVTFALYGRQDNTTCLHKDMGNTNCVASGVLAKVQSACNGSTTCSVRGSHAHFGIADPCQGTYKYITIAYLCRLPKNSFQVYSTENVTMTGNDVRTVNASSEHACASCCANDTQCKSADYTPATSDCVFKTANDSLSTFNYDTIQTQSGVKHLEFQFNDETGCPRGWTMIGNRRCFVVAGSSTLFVTQMQAFEYCASRGALLAVMDSFVEQDGITTLIKMYAASHDIVVANYWMGITKINSTFSGNWSTYNGNMFNNSFTNWRSGEPNERENTCVKMSCRDHGCKWEDARCSEHNNIVCEMEAQGPIKGGWGEFGPWTSCLLSKNRTRTKMCNNPAPSGGGSYCQENSSSTETQSCPTQAKLRMSYYDEVYVCSGTERFQLIIVDKVAFSGHVIETVNSVDSELSCAICCMNDPECQSADYSSVSSTCTFLDVTWDSQTLSSNSLAEKSQMAHLEFQCTLDLGCPPGFHLYDNSKCYAITGSDSLKVAFSEAINYCYARASQPVFVDDVEEKNDIIAFTNRYASSVGSGVETYWLGLQSVEGNNITAWYLLNKTEFNNNSYTYWRHGEPSHDCALMNCKGHNCQWEGADCGSRHHIICEREAFRIMGGWTEVPWNGPCLPCGNRTRSTQCDNPPPVNGGYCNDTSLTATFEEHYCYCPGTERVEYYANDSICDLSIGQQLQVVSTSNRMIFGSELGSLNGVDSELDCIILCLNESGCKSADFSNITNVCILRNVTWSDPDLDLESVQPNITLSHLEFGCVVGDKSPYWWDYSSRWSAFSLSLQQMDYEEAKRYCDMRNSHVLFLNSQEEQRQIVKWKNDKKVSVDVFWLSEATSSAASYDWMQPVATGFHSLNQCSNIECSTTQCYEMAQFCNDTQSVICEKNIEDDEPRSLKNMPDSSFKLSSFNASNGCFSGNACCAVTRSDPRHYGRWDLGVDWVVTAVGTKLLQDGTDHNQGLVCYELYLAMDEDSDDGEKDFPQSTCKVFVGNVDRHTEVLNKLEFPRVARFVGIRLLSSQDWNSLRFEVYGFQYEAPRSKYGGWSHWGA